MNIIHSIHKKVNITSSGVIAIGLFDSLHKGHIKILENLRDIALKKGYTDYLLTYDHLPIKNKKKILRLDDKLAIFKKVGLSNIIIVNFNDDFQKLSSHSFITLLKDNFNIASYVVGKDFKFGYNRTGGIKELEQQGCRIFPVEPVVIDNEKVSTSTIRNFILKGDCERIMKLLGRPYSVSGTVRKGKQLGRTLGYPTMNIYNDDMLHPQNGTYISKTYVNGQEFLSMTYSETNVIETYLIGYDNFAYNFPIKIEFLKKIRQNETFNSLDNLKEQLKKDLTITKQYFNLSSL